MSSIARPLTRVPVAALAIAVIVALVASTAAWFWARQGADAGVGAARSARNDAVEAQAAVADLAAEVKVLRKDLARLEAADAKTADRLAGIKENLWDSLSRLRATLSNTQQGSKAARAAADAALGEAVTAARQLNVLEDRFEYHLRADHGGG